MQRRQCAALLGEQQQTRGVAVESMHEFKEARQRPLRAQLLDDAETDAAAAVYREPGWLVEHQQVLVFVEDSVLELGVGRRCGARRLCGDSHRRQAQFVTRSQAISGLGAAAVDPHFSAAQDAVHMAFWHPFEYFQQIVVDSLATGFFGYSMTRHGIFAQILHFAYTICWLTDFRTKPSRAQALHRGKRRRNARQVGPAPLSCYPSAVSRTAGDYSDVDDSHPPKQMVNIAHHKK